MSIDGGWYYEMQDLGYNYRLSDIHAALGLSQLSKAKNRLNRRIEIARKYEIAFRSEPWLIGQSRFLTGHAYHLYIIEVRDRLGLFNYLHRNGIQVQVHYVPIHLMPYYQQFGWKNGDFPHAEAYYSQCISLPIYPSLSDVEQKFVIDKVKEYYIISDP